MKAVVNWAQEPINHELLRSFMDLTMGDKAKYEAERLEHIIKHNTPKWWQWCVSKGGLYKWIATKLIKVIIIQS